MTPGERAKVEAAVDKHIERIRGERVQGATPTSEKAVRDAAYAAAEKTYRERRRDGQADAGARKAASDSGKLAADHEWTVQAEELAIDKANQAIEDGTVFDRSAIRLKPHGDEFNGWRPSYSVEVNAPARQQGQATRR